MKLLTRSHPLTVGSCLRLLLFGIVLFLAEELFRIKIYTEEVLFRSIYFYTAYQLFQKSYILVTYTEEIHNGKLHFLCSDSYILEKANFLKSNIPHYPHFLESYLFEWLLFQKTYLFTRYIFTRVTDLQLGFLSTDTFPIYQSVIK